MEMERTVEEIREKLQRLEESFLGVTPPGSNTRSLFTPIALPFLDTTKITPPGGELRRCAAARSETTPPGSAYF